MNNIFNKIQTNCERLNFNHNSFHDSLCQLIIENKDNNIVLYKTLSETDTYDYRVGRPDILIGFFLDKKCPIDLKINIKIIGDSDNIFKIVLNKNFYIKPGTFEYFLKSCPFILMMDFFSRIVITIDEKYKEYFFNICGVVESKIRYIMMHHKNAIYYIDNKYYICKNGEFKRYYNKDYKMSSVRYWLNNREILIPNLN